MLINHGIENICHRVISGEWKRHGSEYCIGDVHGGAGDSLKVHLHGDKAGMWCDFANPENKGDLIDLWRLGRGIQIGESIREVKEYLNVTDPFSNRAARAKEFTRPPVAKLKQLMKSSPIVAYLTNDRKLGGDWIKRYKIGQVEPANGKGWAISYPFYNAHGELVNIKYIALEREDGKKRSWQEANAEPCLFGWQALDPDVRGVVITEGELDAVSLAQYGYAALSVPLGAGPKEKQKWIEQSWEALERFDDIYLCFDNETDHDKKAMVQVTRDDISQRLGKHRCYNVYMPDGIKDPNEALQKGITKEEISDCFARAVPTKPASLKKAGDFYSKIYQRIYNPDRSGQLIPWGLTPVSGKLPKKVRFRPGEVTLITGQTGQGKSAVLRNILVDLGLHGERVCNASFEEPPDSYLRRMTSILCGQLRMPVEHMNRAMEWLDDHVFCTDRVGEMKLGELLDVFRYAYRRYGCSWFVIDSLMCLDDVPEEDLDAQKKAVQKICSFAQETKTHIFLVAHPNKASGTALPVGTLGVAGSAKLVQRVDNMLSVWRNTMKEMGDVNQQSEPDAMLTLMKNREEGFLTKYPLWYDVEAMQYLEEDEKPAPKIDLPWVSTHGSRVQGAFDVEGNYNGSYEEITDD
jgi:twinkle protein